MPDHDQEFVEFVESAGTSLQRLAYLVCGDRHLADDVVQDALYKVYLAWGRIDRRGNPLGYARRAVVRTAVDAGRRPWRRREVPAQGVPDRAADPADPVGALNDRDELLAVLRGLPPRQRACVVLRYYEDLSVEQTADVLGCSEGTVKSQAARGLQSLRQAMNDLRSLRETP